MSERAGGRKVSEVRKVEYTSVLADEETIPGCSTELGPGVSSQVVQAGEMD